MAEENDEKCCCGCQEECQNCECEECSDSAEKGEEFDAEALKKENASLKDFILRAHAEMENLRKRFAKEKDDVSKYCATKFAKELLGVMDNFERAFANSGDAENSAKAFFDGIKITHKELTSALSKNGITKIDAKKSDDFDHNFHQIMCEVDSEDVEGGKIVDVYQNGYMINDRLLRPALVSVAKKK